MKTILICARTCRNKNKMTKHMRVAIVVCNFVLPEMALNLLAQDSHTLHMRVNDKVLCFFFGLGLLGWDENMAIIFFHSTLPIIFKIKKWIVFIISLMHFLLLSDVGGPLLMRRYSTHL